MSNGAATIVGIGVVAPGGSTVDDVWCAVHTAEGTLAETIAYPSLEPRVVLGCRADGFVPSERLERHELRRLDRAHQMAFWAADDALNTSGSSPDPDRCAVVVGTGFGAAEFMERQYAAVFERGYRGTSPLSIPVIMPNSIAAHLSIRFGFSGPSLTVSSACASGANAIGEALWLLRSGRADRVLVGGVDALHTPNVTASFARMEAMSRRLADPAASSRPFDAGRDGFVLGEGAAFMVLERHDDTPEGLGRILGYGSTTDAHHIVAPPDDGAGATACMRAALRDAGLDPADIGHVNAHGTSTPKNDLAEAKAIAEVFGDRAVAVTSTKGVTGHLVGAAGAVEAVITTEANNRLTIPPTTNVVDVDPAIEPLIDVVRSPRSTRIPIAMSNSFGFGGHNATLVIG